MIPVTQTKVVVNKSTGEKVVHGNCYAACIASIMGLPITEVPNVEVLFDIDDFYWSQVMHTWLNSKGWELYTNNDFKVFHDEHYGVNDGRREDYLNSCSGKYYLVSGKSPRGVMHMCVYKDGQLVHDPHPTREGVSTCEYFEELIKK
ncbi:MAG: hypothetical protein ACTHMM_18380 [Agriterribacter sp.]